MIGILISSLSNDMKSYGNSLANTCISSLGQLPAPYVYGAILKLDKKSKQAFNFTLLISWLGILFIALTAYFRYKLPDEEEKIEDKSENKEDRSENKEIDVNCNEKSISRIKVLIKFK